MAKERTARGGARPGTGGETGKRGAAFRPFADAAAVAQFGGLSFENGPERIAVHGSLDLTRDRQGLAQAKALKATVDAIVKALKAEGATLPEASPEPESVEAKAVPNPFA